MRKIFFLLSFLVFFSCVLSEDDQNTVTVDESFLTNPYTDLNFREVGVGTKVTFFSSRESADIYFGLSSNTDALTPDNWQEGSEYTFDTTGDVKLFLKDRKDGTDSEWFSEVYAVLPSNKVFSPMPALYMQKIHKDASITFSTRTFGAQVWVGYNTDQSATEPSLWSAADTLILDITGSIKIFAKATKAGFDDSAYYTKNVEVVDYYPSEAGQPDTTAIYKDSALFRAWAVGYSNYVVGEECDSVWQVPGKAYGKAVGNSMDIVCLGRGGAITMRFSSKITDGSGDDFAVFENAFNDSFLELGFVEVSTNGTDFVRFDNASLTSSLVSDIGAVDAKLISGFAGKYKQGYGTPFDLSELNDKENVVNGRVRLDNIRYIRILDINGDGNTQDSFGNAIYDPYPCVGSAGFDLDAIGLIN